ncbi:MAG: DUF2723 domain-containing protein [Gemmatimonadaceae bacterium]
MSATTSTKFAEIDYRPSYGAAAIAAALVFVLYLLTLSPSTAMWDTSEYITAAFTLGLPHPPGNPFFVLLGRFFSILPIAPNVAMRINMLAALCSAVSAGMWFLIAERVLAGWLPSKWQRRVGGALAALIGSTAFTVWAQSVVNEKVYTVSLVGMAIVAWLAVRWCDDPDSPKADRLLVLIAYLSGLGYANHMAGFLALPAVFIAVLVIRPRTFLRYKLVLAGLLAIGLGMTPFLTQPIRSAYFPRINEGETTGCVTKIAADCTFSKLTYDRFMYNFNRTQYGKPALTDRQVPFTAQVGMWWTYFRWQWLRDANGTHAAAQELLAWVFLLLGLLGGWVHWQRDRKSFWFFGSLIFTVTLVLIYYMNFKYGYSQAPELGDAVPREVRDRDYFYLWSFSAWSVWVALGLFDVWHRIAQMLGADPVMMGAETVEVPRKSSWMAASPLLLVAIIPLFANWSTASRHGQTDTRDFAHDLLESVEPYGVLITVGDNDTFPLWYAQEVEGIRPDVTVLCTSLLNTDWYTRQLIRNPIRPYDKANGPPAYADRMWTQPTKAPINLTYTQSDSVPPAVALSAPQELKTVSGFTFNVQPRDLGGGYHGLERADLFVLYIIRDAFPATPVYFSRTDGTYPDEMGFGNNLITTGLARKLVATPPTPSSTIMKLPNEGWFDVATTYSLWTKTFDAPKSLARRDGWVDRPSVGIPYVYVRTGALLAEALIQDGRKAEAQQVMATAQRVAAGTGLADLLAAQQQ